MTLSQHDSSPTPPHSLREAIQRGGFYPDLVLHTVLDALDGREPTHQIVHVDTHFDLEEVHRHITCLVLADDVVVVSHLDDHETEPADGRHSHEEHSSTQQHPEFGQREAAVFARVSTEVVPVARIRSLILSEVHSDPQRFDVDRGLAELTLTMNWSGGSRIDVMPADCGDPECIADHGESGTVVAEDVTLRIAATAEGDIAVDQARQFVRALRRSSVRYAR